MRVDIRYVTSFRYPQPVYESQNELRACPANDERQQLLHYHVTTTPSSRVVSYVDYWGTRVDTFGVRPPHRELTVVAEANVETAAQSAPPDGLRRSMLAEQSFLDANFAYLQRSPHADWGPQVAAAAREAADAADDDVVAVLHAVHERVAQLDYRTDVTYVGVAVDHVFETGAGVCQDFAHLAVAMYRALDIPARYVSGYLFTADDASGEDADTDEVEVQTHAWVEAAVPGWGWLALDPTNRQPVGERHVTIGRGRDYDDVAPFRGVFSGPSEHDIEVGVTMRRFVPTVADDAPSKRRGDGSPTAAQQHVAQ